jgi:hypothetical protein
LSVLLREEEEDLDRIIVFLEALTFLFLEWLTTRLPYISIWRGGIFGESGEDGHVDSSADIL